MAISIRSKAIPKNSNVFLNFACAVSAFFTDVLPACTNIHAMIIKSECSMVKKRSMGSFMLSPICFKLSNHPLVKYSIRPINNWISIPSIKKKLLRPSLILYSLFVANPLIARITVQKANIKISQRIKLCNTSRICIINNFCKSKG